MNSSTVVSYLKGFIIVVVLLTVGYGIGYGVGAVLASAYDVLDAVFHKPIVMLEYRESLQTYDMSEVMYDPSNGLPFVDVMIRNPHDFDIKNIAVGLDLFDGNVHSGNGEWEHKELFPAKSVTRARVYLTEYILPVNFDYHYFSFVWTLHVPEGEKSDDFRYIE